jgi:hypothetical protein
MNLLAKQYIAEYRFLAKRACYSRSIFALHRACFEASVMLGRSASGLAVLRRVLRCMLSPSPRKVKEVAMYVRSKKRVAQEGPYPFGHVRSTYLNLLLHNIGRLIVLADAYRGEGGSTYQVADNDLAFSSSGKSGADNRSGGGGSSGLATGVLGSGGVLGDTSSRDSGLVTTTRATGVVAASAGNLLEGLVKLGRHCVCVCLEERCVSYEREKLATV